MKGSMIIWMTAVCTSLILLVISAAIKAPHLHLLVSAMMSIFFALAGIQESRQMRAEGQSPMLIAASNARFMGMVWTWGAAALLMTYGFILSWKEWLPFFMGFVVAAGLCLFFSATLKKDEAAGTVDPIMKKIGNALTIGQVVGMGIAMVGLIVDGKLSRFAKARPGWEDWAANNIFFFGAFALFAIGLHALLADRKSTVPA
jgi:hypothetical protein